MNFPLIYSNYLSTGLRQRIAKAIKIFIIYLFCVTNHITKNKSLNVELKNQHEFQKDHLELHK